MTDAEHVFTVTVADEGILDAGRAWDVKCSCGGLRGVVIPAGLDTMLQAHQQGAQQS
jgi:hypothetical protein